MPPFADREVSRSQRDGFLRPEPLHSFKQLLNGTQEAEWTPFQTHYFSENLVASEIESGLLDLQLRTLDY
jgi:hypothetical protein